MRLRRTTAVAAVAEHFADLATDLALNAAATVLASDEVHPRALCAITVRNFVETRTPATWMKIKKVLERSNAWVTMEARIVPLDKRCRAASAALPAHTVSARRLHLDVLNLAGLTDQLDNLLFVMGEMNKFS